MQQKGVYIDGYVFAETGDLDRDEFLDAFIDFIESKNWQFGGITKAASESPENWDEEGEHDD